VIDLTPKTLLARLEGKRMKCLKKKGKKQRTLKGGVSGGLFFFKIKNSPHLEE